MSVRVLGLTETCNTVGLKKSTLYNLIKIGKFPSQVILSPGRRGFLSSDVDQWLNERQYVHANTKKAA